MKFVINSAEKGLYGSRPESVNDILTEISTTFKEIFKGAKGQKIKIIFFFF